MYEKIGWEDSPSKNTPLTAENLNQMDNGIRTANNGIMFGCSATFTADGVIKKVTTSSELVVGDFATNQKDLTTVFISNKVTSIGGGTFAECTSLKTIYIDNTVGNITISSGAIPDGVSVVYCNDDGFINVNDFLANAIKSLKDRTILLETKENQLEEQHRVDVQSLADKANQLETQATKDRENFTSQLETTNESVIGKESLSNKVNEIIFPSVDYYPSSKGVWDYVNGKFTDPLADIEQNKTDIAKLKVDKVDNTDFDAYKATNDTAVKKNATDIAQLNADVLQNAIKPITDKSTSAALQDSSSNNILKLVCDNSKFQVRLYKKNLFDFSSCNVFTNDGAKTTLVDRTNNIVKFTTNENVNTSGIYFRHTTLNGMKGYEVDYTKLPNKTVTLSFDIVSNTDCQMRFSFITNNWSNYTSITTSKQRIIITELVDISKLNNAMTFYCNKSNAEITISNIQIEVNSVATDYEKCEFQSVDNSTDLTTVHTYYPTTTVIADSDCQLTYIADTKNYIDNKLNEIATALVAHESEVM